MLDDSPWNLVTTVTSVGDSCTVCISREAYSCKNCCCYEGFCDYQLDQGLFCDNNNYCNCWCHSHHVDLFWGFHPYMSLFLPLENVFGRLPDFFVSQDKMRGGSGRGYVCQFEIDVIVVSA